MYKKTKEMVAENVIQKYKLKSVELSKKYNMDVLLKDFKKEIMEEKNETF